MPASWFVNVEIQQIFYLPLHQIILYKYSLTTKRYFRYQILG